MCYNNTIDIKKYQEYHQSVKFPTKISHRLLKSNKYKHSDIELIRKMHSSLKISTLKQQQNEQGQYKI